MRKPGRRTCVIVGRPITKGRPRLGRRRKAYTPSRTLDYEKLVRDAWVDKFGETPYEGPVGIKLVIDSNQVTVDVWKMPTSKRPKYITGDADNHLKAVADGLNGVAYVDDKQIHFIQVEFQQPDGYTTSTTRGKR